MRFWYKIIKDANGISTLLGLSFVIIFMGLLSPLFIIQIFNRYISFGLEGTLFFLITGAVMVSITEYIFRNLRHTYCANIIIQPIKKLKLSISSLYFNSPSFYQKYNKNISLRELIDLKNHIYQVLNPINQSNILDFIFAIMILIILFLLNVKLTLIFLIFFILVFLIQLLILKNKKNMVNNDNSELSFFLDLTAKSHFLRILNNFKYIGSKFSEILDKQLNMLKTIAINSSNHINLNHFILIFNSILVIGIGSYFVVEGFLNIGTLIGFNIFSTRALQISINAQNSYFNLKKISNYLRVTNAYFGDFYDKKKFLKLNNKQFSINLNKVNLGQSFGSSSLIKNFSFIINPGEIINISGPNGCGKTLLCKVILGDNKNFTGDITVNGIDLKKISLKWWRDIVGFVPQNQYCLNTTILDNLVISNEIIKEDIILKKLNFFGLDRSLRNANLTLNSLMSSNTSVGIHKKIHYARVMIGNKKIILIDDPFENLDLEGKQFVLKFLNYLKSENKTIICFGNEDEIIKISNRKYIIND
tara:strand:- start:1173 stop:2768 length:1596 start_codon:yes stop_codon:yes gene_type:complete